MNILNGKRFQQEKSLHNVQHRLFRLIADSFRLAKVCDGVFLILLGMTIGVGVLSLFSTIRIGGTIDRDHTSPGELVKDISIEQRVPVKAFLHADSICYEVLFATYQRTNSAQLKIALSQNGYHQVMTLNAAVLKDNRTFPLCFPADGLVTGEAILEIYGMDGLPGKSPTVWMTPDIPYGAAIVNEKKLRSGLVFSTYVKSDTFFFSILSIGFFSLVAVLIFLFFIRKQHDRELWSKWRIRFIDSRTGKALVELVDYRNSMILYAVIGLTLAMSMAAISRVTITNPDEELHARSVKFYQAHNLPPAVGDPAAAPTYCTKYGVSYINQIGITYFLIGKFSNVMQRISHYDGPILYRAFNIFLFIILWIMCYLSHERLMWFPIIITPQIWYVASYTNNDFFPFFVMMLICHELLNPESLYARAIQGRSLFFALPAGILIGILTISKANYLVFVMYVGCYLAWNSLRLNRFSPDRNLLFSRPVKVMMLILTCSASIYFFRTGYDIYQNGFDKERNLVQIANQVGAKGFRPMDLGNDIKNTYPGLRLREKGVALVDMIIGRNWYAASINSFLGVYGGMKLEAVRPYYQWVCFLFYSLLLYTAIRVVIDFRKEYLALLAGSIFFILLMVFISIYHSWTYDFQPQGRYLFPILGILSILIHLSRDNVNRYIVGLLIFLMFMSGCWSFLFVGVYRIDKLIL